MPNSHLSRDRVCERVRAQLVKKQASHRNEAHVQRLPVAVWAVPICDSEIGNGIAMSLPMVISTASRAAKTNAMVSRNPLSGTDTAGPNISRLIESDEGAAGRHMRLAAIRHVEVARAVAGLFAWLDDPLLPQGSVDVSGIEESLAGKDGFEAVRWVNDAPATTRASGRSSSSSSSSAAAPVDARGWFARFRRSCHSSQLFSCASGHVDVLHARMEDKFTVVVGSRIEQLRVSAACGALQEPDGGEMIYMTYKFGTECCAVGPGAGDGDIELSHAINALAQHLVMSHSDLDDTRVVRLREGQPGVRLPGKYPGSSVCDHSGEEDDRGGHDWGRRIMTNHGLTLRATFSLLHLHGGLNTFRAMTPQQQRAHVMAHGPQITQSIANRF